MKTLSRLTIALLLALSCFAASAAAPQDQKAKTVVILGDSYSTFEGYIPAGYACWYWTAPDKGNEVHSVSQTWWDLLLKKTGYTLLLNSSFSGSTICNRGYRGLDYSDRSYITRMKRDIVTEDGQPGACGEFPDFLFIFGGTNDDWAGAPMGKVLTKDELPGADFYQCLPAASYMLSYLKEKLPATTRIIVIVNSELSDTITLGLQQAAKLYGVESILLENIGKTTNHPNIEGMKAICEQLIAIL